jgi:hypothetical protein
MIMARIFFYAKETRLERKARYKLRRRGIAKGRLVHTYTSFVSAGVVKTTCGNQFNRADIVEFNPYGTDGKIRPFTWDRVGCPTCEEDWKAEQLGEFFKDQK